MADLFDAFLEECPYDTTKHKGGWDHKLKDPDTLLLIEFIQTLLIDGYRNTYIKKQLVIEVGLTVPAADTVIAMPGRILFVEFKALDGKQSREQKAFERKIRRLGFEYYIVKTEQQFKNIVKGNVEENKE